MRKAQGINPALVLYESKKKVLENAPVIDLRHIADSVGLHIKGIRSDVKGGLVTALRRTRQGLIQIVTGGNSRSWVFINWAIHWTHNRSSAEAQIYFFDVKKNPLFC